MSRKMVCQALLVLLLAGACAAWGGQMPQSINNNKELRAALKAAKTPEDHVRIADYSQAKAQNLDAQAADYERAAAACRNGPVVKNLMAPDSATRYEAKAKELRDEAQSNRELAASHEQTAKNAAQTSP